MSKVESCLLKVSEAFKEKGLSKREISEALKDIDQLARDLSDGNANLYESALEKIMDMPDFRPSAADKKRLRNIKQHLSVKRMKSAFEEQYPEKTSDDFGHFLTDYVDARKKTLESRTSADFGKFLSTKFKNEKGQEILMGDWYLNNRSDRVSQKNFADEMRAISEGGQTGATGDVGASMFARWVMDTRAKRREMMAEMGADIRMRNDYQGNQTLSQARVIKAGEDAFVDTQINRINWKETLGLDEVSSSMKVKYLKNIYKDITDGEGLQHGKGMFLDGADDIQASAIAHRYEQTRSIVYKDNESYLDAMKDYGGDDNIFDAAVGDVIKMSHDAAIINTMGANPAQSYRTLRTSLGFDKQTSFFSHDAIFKNITAEANMFGNTTNAVQSARLLGGTRNVISTAFLGEVALASFSEVAVSNSAIRRSVGQNRGLINGITDTFHSFKNKDDQRLFAQIINLETQSLINKMSGGMNRYGDVLPEGVTSRMLQRLYEFSGMRYMESHQKDAVIARVGSTWHAYKGRSFSDLESLSTPDMKLSKFGVTEDMWNFMRTLDSVTDQNGNQYLITDPLHTVDSSRIANEYLKDSNASPRRIEKSREEMISAFNSYLIRSAENGMLTPNARDMSVINFGYRRGTAPGEALRTTMHLSTFPVMAFTRVVRPMVKNREFTALAMYAAYATTLGYASMVSRDMMRGRNRDYLTDDPELQFKMWSEAFARGGAGTIFYDFLYQYARYDTDPGGRVGGLSMALLADALKVVDAGTKTAYDIATTGGHDMDDNLERLGRETVKSARKYIPFGTLPGVRQVLDNMIYYPLLNQVSPDSVKRMERYWQQETGGDFFFDVAR